MGHTEQYAKEEGLRALAYLIGVRILEIFGILTEMLEALRLWETWGLWLTSGKKSKDEHSQI